MEIDIGPLLYNQLYENKELLKLDLDPSNFEKQCYFINKIRIKHDYFFQIFELKDKFRYLTSETNLSKKYYKKTF